MNEEWINDFDQYLFGQLSSGERSDFEKRLRADAEMRAAFKEYNALVYIVEDAGNEDLRSKLKEVHAEKFGVKPATKVVKMRSLRMLYAAAVVAVLIGATLWAALGSSSSPQELYAANFDVYQGLTTTRGDSDLHVLWEKINTKYMAGDYEATLVMLGQAEVEELKPDYLIHFYSGQCLMAQDKPNYYAAIDAFDIVLTSDNDFHAQSRWYRALAWMQLGESENAIADLEELSNTSRYKSEEVERLLRDLR